MKIIEEILFRILNRWGFRFWVMSPVRLYNSLCGKFVYRPFVEFLAAYYGERRVVGVEVGVCEGTFARMLLRRLNLVNLYLVDPYLKYDEYTDDLGTGTDDFSKFEATARKKLKRYKNKTFVKYMSKKAAHLFRDESLDFVNIDANHAYAYVVEDIEAWWDKVKKGGILGGHDMDASFLGVCRAVVEFTNKKKVVLLGKENEWWVVKT